MISELSDRIEDALQNIDLPGHLPELYRPISYSLELGGKRLRPLLLMLSSRLFGAEDAHSMNQALAVELFHNFTLVHDDIMDNAALRRGRESVFKKWDQNTAILSGDVMFSISMQYASMCGSDILPDVMETFLDMTVKVCEGQQMDMNFEKRDDVILDEYIEMIELKTAYLMAGSLKLGAILAKAGKEAENAMFEYGIKSGTAFQLMDDYLDAFGDPEKFGKTVGGDILAGKKTYLYIETKNRLEGDERTDFLEFFNSGHLNEETKVSRVVEYFSKSGAADALRGKAESLLSEATDLLKDLGGNEEAKQELINLTHLLTKREK